MDAPITEILLRLRHDGIHRLSQPVADDLDVHAELLVALDAGPGVAYELVFGFDDVHEPCLGEVVFVLASDFDNARLRCRAHVGQVASFVDAGAQVGSVIRVDVEQQALVLHPAAGFQVVIGLPQDITMDVETGKHQPGMLQDTVNT